MERLFSYQITSKENKIPIGLFLRSMGYSSKNIIALKKMPESILLNGLWAYVSALLSEGDILTIHIKENASSAITPVELPLPILYEDEDILIIDKPAGMPIHPSQNNYNNTLANAAAYYYSYQNIPYTFRCINRLDRDTTGLTILSKHMLSASILSAMVQHHEVKREYLAIVEGILECKDGCISAPIARADHSTIERIIDFKNGETAVTHYHVEKENDSISLLSLWLESGRTHQIRVHMKHIGHPILGDFLYNPDMRLIRRQALHSHRLTFLHPITKKPLTFTAPLPDDMRFI